MLYKVEGIVIKTVPYGESNTILTLYTKELGKIGVMARGAKKPKSRFTSITQLFTYGIFVFQRSRGLGTLQQGEALSSFRKIREDLVKTAYAAYLAELLDRHTTENELKPDLFGWIKQALEYINHGIDPEVITFLFELKMMKTAGIVPELSRCVSCQSTEGTFAFSIREGGFLCERCVYKDPYRIHISKGAARLLNMFYHLDLARLGNVSLKKETKKELRMVFDAYMDEYSGVYLKSRKFIKQLDDLT
ncbi:DNA repair protein RecO [Fictibacillus nanhaiensis]|uniref:DNA repair protein RecO n=1 Tax=Fictibacillus nanhaiensis TaxID=742169 RepID=UPI001C958007|nr:DNA repair protein RecO [Fictibacillus nanhaiensis]MBY6035449.1 DNA repair protein RecO [Fictibacillus nanhaiensis]